MSNLATGPSRPSTLETNHQPVPGVRLSSEAWENLAWLFESTDTNRSAVIESLLRETKEPR